MPASKHHGLRYFAPVNASKNYPSDGFGNLTTTAADSDLAAATKVIIVRIVIAIDSGAGTVDYLFEHHDSSDAIFTIKFDAAPVLTTSYELGVEIPGGFSVTATPSAGDPHFAAIYYADLS